VGRAKLGIQRGLRRCLNSLALKRDSLEGTIGSYGTRRRRLWIVVMAARTTTAQLVSLQNVQQKTGIYQTIINASSVIFTPSIRKLLPT
jgi:hypothetical protein